MMTFIFVPAFGRLRRPVSASLHDRQGRHGQRFAHAATHGQLAIVKGEALGQTLHMRAALLLCVMVLLPGCLPVNTYYAEGVSFARLERDNTQCDVAALRDAPVANQTRQYPPRFIRRQVCNNQGHCQYSGGYWVPGEFYTVDVNADLRKRVKGLCMGDRGYRPVELPACPQGIAKVAPPGPSPILPRLNANSCAIRTDGGGFRIITQG